MAKQRPISTRFWHDGYVQELSTPEKLLFLYLLTNEQLDLCGLYELSIRTIQFESGLDSKTVSKALERFQKDGKVFYIDGWICIKNFTKHLKVNPNIQTGIERSLKAVPPKVFKDFESLSKHSLLNLTLPNSTLPNLSGRTNKFAPPSSKEVLDFFKENNGSSSEDFVDFYQSKGWLVGKVKMKDWKAAARRWIRSNSSTEETVVLFGKTHKVNG